MQVILSSKQKLIPIYDNLFNLFESFFSDISINGQVIPLTINVVNYNHEFT